MTARSGYSACRWLGLEETIWIARTMHLAMVALLFVMLHVFGLGAIALAGMCLVVVLLAYEHT